MRTNNVGETQMKYQMTYWSLIAVKCTLTHFHVISNISRGPSPTHLNKCKLRLTMIYIGCVIGWVITKENIHKRMAAIMSGRLSIQEGGPLLWYQSW